MKQQIELVQLQSIERHGLSYYGNPTLKVEFTYTFANGITRVITAKTGSNCACGYSLQNYKSGDFVWLQFHFTKNGNCIITRESVRNFK